MEQIAYVEINLVPSLMLCILLANARVHRLNDAGNRLFAAIMVLLVLAMGCDTAIALYAGQPGETACAIMWASNAFYFILTFFICFTWARYTYFQLKNGEELVTRKRWFVLLPLVIGCVVTLLSPWTDGLFYIDAQNYYVRGPQFWVQTFTGYIYIGAAFLATFYAFLWENNSQRRQQLALLAAFPLMPFVSSVLQLWMAGTTLVWPFTTLSVLLLYINQTNEQISRDALTGLNNRGQFDQHVKALCGSSPDAKVRLFLLDVDRFKYVNDHFGHVMGDKALIEVAGLLRQVLGRTPSFIARYGGDEFAVVVRGDGEEAQTAIETLDTLLAAKSHVGMLKFPLTVSWGSAVYGKEGAHSVEELIRQADASMYAHKKKNRSEKEKLPK